MEINGYEIDTFNIYGLDTRANKSTCPKCSHTRKKKTQKCMMLDWDRGLGTCQHCGVVLQLHTYKNKNSQSFVLPHVEMNPIQEKVYNWFQTRGIDRETLQRTKVTNGVEFMPQIGKKANVIMFNYYVDDILVNIKYRDAMKNFKLHKGSQKTFYNINSIKDTECCVIVEGEIDCLSYKKP